MAEEQRNLAELAYDSGLSTFLSASEIKLMDVFKRERSTRVWPAVLDELGYQKGESRKEGKGDNEVSAQEYISPNESWPQVQLSQWTAPVATMKDSGDSRHREDITINFDPQQREKASQVLARLEGYDSKQIDAQKALSLIESLEGNQIHVSFTPVAIYIGEIPGIIGGPRKHIDDDQMVRVLESLGYELSENEMGEYYHHPEEALPPVWIDNPQEFGDDILITLTNEVTESEDLIIEDLSPSEFHPAWREAYQVMLRLAEAIGED